MATNSVSDEEATMLAKVTEDGNALKHASDEWKNNTKVVLAVAAKRGCVPGPDDATTSWDGSTQCYEYDGWMPLKGGGGFSNDNTDGGFCALFPLVHAAPVLKGAPTLRRVAGIADDAERAAACADPATVWAVDVEQQAIGIRTGTLERYRTLEMEARGRGEDEYHRYLRCGCYDVDRCDCGGGPEFPGNSIRRVAAAAEKVAAIQAAPLQIVAAGGNTYLLAAGWWSVPGGDLVALARAQHPALAEASQQFYLGGGGGGGTSVATVPLLLSGPTPPKAVLVWLAEGEEAPAPTPYENENIMDWSSKEMVHAKVVEDGCMLKHASTELRGNRAMVLAAVAENGYALSYASSELQGDKEVVLAAAAAPHFGRYLGSFMEMDCIPAALKADVDVMRAAALTAFADGVEQCQERRGDTDMLSVLANVPDEFRSDSTFWSGLDRWEWQFGQSRRTGQRNLPPWELPDDEEVVLALVTGYGPALQHASEQLKGNKNFLLALFAATQDGRAFEYVSDELKDDEQLILAAAIPGPRSRESELLHDAADFKLNKGEFLSALRESSVLPNPDCSRLALKHAPAELKSDKAFIVAAAACSGEALAGVPALLKANVELRLSLVAKLGHSLASLGHVPPALKASPSLQRVAGIVDAAERTAVCADPTTVWAVDVEQQAIAISAGAALAAGTEDTDAEFWMSSDDDDDADHYYTPTQDEERQHTAEFTAELAAELADATAAELEQFEPPALTEAKAAMMEFAKPFMEVHRLSQTDRQEYDVQHQSLSNAVAKINDETDAARKAAAQAEWGFAPNPQANGDTERPLWDVWFNTGPLEDDPTAEARSDDDGEEPPKPALAAPRAICDCWESEHWGSCCVRVEKAVDEAAERVAASQAAPLQIVDIGGNTYPLAAGWWSVPGGDLVAQALAQHPVLAEAAQRFELVTSDGTATPATVPLLLPGPMPPKAVLVWVADDTPEAPAGAKRARVE